MPVDTLVQAIRNAKDATEKYRLTENLKAELASLSTLKSSEPMGHGGLFANGSDLNILGEALSSNTSITSLDFSKWHSTPGPTQFLDKIKNNRTLSSLTLHSWRLDEIEAKALAHLLENGQIKRFTFSCLPDEPMDSASFAILAKALSKSQTLEELTLYWFAGDEMGKNIAQIIQHNRTLTEISIAGQPPTTNREQLAETVINSELQSFHWSERGEGTPEWEQWKTHVFDKIRAKRQAAKQAKQEALEAECRAKLDAQFAAEAAQRAAQKAAKEAQRITDIENKANEIVKNMNFLEVKDRLYPLLESMGENPTDRQKTILLNALNQLDDLTFSSLTLIFVNPLSIITLTPASIKHILEALEKNNTITTLTLENLNIGKEELKAISKVLSNNKKITTLYLNRNKIDIESLDVLIEIIKNNPNLHLSLYNNPLLENSAAVIEHFKKNHTVLDKDTIATLSNIFSDSEEAIKKVLKNNAIIHEASQITADMDNEEKSKRLTALLRSMKENPSDSQKSTLKTALDQFTTLHLAHQELTDAHIEHLAEALKTNTTITYVNLFNNKITHQGTDRLCEALLINKTLSGLRLALNDIDENCINSFVSVLEKNKTLTYLELSNNPLKSSAISLIKALKNNTTLKALHLQNVALNIDNQAAFSCLEALKDNQSLLVLNFLESFGFSNDNTMTPTTAALFLTLLEKNQTILQIFLPNERSIDYETRLQIKYYLEINLELSNLKSAGEALSEHFIPPIAHLIADYAELFDKPSELKVKHFEKGLAITQKRKAAEKAHANELGEGLGEHLISPIAKLIGEYSGVFNAEDFEKGLTIGNKRKAEAAVARQKAEAEAAAAAKQKTQEEAAQSKIKEQPFINITPPVATLSEPQPTKVIDPASLKKNSRVATLAAVAIGVVASTLIFVLSTPLIAGIVLSIFALIALISFVNSAGIGKAANQSIPPVPEPINKPSSVIEALKITPSATVPVQSPTEVQNPMAPSSSMKKQN